MKKLKARIKQYVLFVLLILLIFDGKSSAGMLYQSQPKTINTKLDMQKLIKEYPQPVDSKIKNSADEHFEIVTLENIKLTKQHLTPKGMLSLVGPIASVSLNITTPIIYGDRYDWMLHHMAGYVISKVTNQPLASASGFTVGKEFAHDKWLKAGKFDKGDIPPNFFGALHAKLNTRND